MKSFSCGTCWPSSRWTGVFVCFADGKYLAFVFQHLESLEYLRHAKTHRGVNSLVFYPCAAFRQ